MAGPALTPAGRRGGVGGRGAVGVLVQPLAPSLPPPPSPKNSRPQPGGGGRGWGAGPRVACLLTVNSPGAGEGVRAGPGAGVPAPPPLPREHGQRVQGKPPLRVSPQGWGPISPRGERHPSLPSGLARGPHHNPASWDLIPVSEEVRQTRLPPAGSRLGRGGQDPCWARPSPWLPSHWAPSRGGLRVPPAPPSQTAPPPGPALPPAPPPHGPCTPCRRHPHPTGPAPQPQPAGGSPALQAWHRGPSTPGHSPFSTPTSTPRPSDGWGSELAACSPSGLPGLCPARPPGRLPLVPPAAGRGRAVPGVGLGKSAPSGGQSGPQTLPCPLSRFLVSCAL